MLHPATNRLIVHVSLTENRGNRLNLKGKDGAPKGIKAREDLRSALRVNLRPMDYEITSSWTEHRYLRGCSPPYQPHSYQFRYQSEYDSYRNPDFRW